MSSSDARLFEGLVARVASLEDQVVELGALIRELQDRVAPKDLTEELYGNPADHTVDRQERAEIMRRGPGRPPGSRPT